MIASVFGVNRILPSQTFGLTTANFSNTFQKKILWDEFLVHENFDVHCITIQVLFYNIWIKHVKAIVQTLYLPPPEVHQSVSFDL